MTSFHPGRALEGFTVLDFSTMIAGPYCTRWLADMGADVIKVEPPEGDSMRSSPPLRDGRSSYFGHLNAGKRSIVLDLKSAEGLAAAKSLLHSADVLVENFRPGVMDRLGLGWATVSQDHPRLVYCSISGFGQSGPKSDRPSYAPIVQAASGYELAHMSYQLGQDSPPSTGLFPADVLSASYATIAIEAALLQRSRTGLGQRLDVTLIESITSVMVYEFQQAQFPDTPVKKPYLPMQAKDGFVIVAAITQRNVENLCDAIGKPELKRDPRLVDSPARRAHWDYFMALIADWTRERSAADCESLLLAAGVPCTRYASIAEVLADPHFQARGSFAPVDDGSGPFLVQSLPYQMSGASTQVSPRVPALGEHTKEVLSAAMRS